MHADAAKAPQAEAIRKATLKSFRSRNAYAEHVVADMTKSLAAAEKDVRQAILKYKSPASPVPRHADHHRERADDHGGPSHRANRRHVR